MRKLAAGNWKMNGTGASLGEVETLLGELGGASGCDVLLCPPGTLLHRLAARCAGSPIRVGGQDCHVAASGAHTGDVSAEMLAEAGAAFVIVGHSERRHDHAEDDAAVRAKAEAALRAGLVPIVCVGETEAEREAGRALEVVARQMAGSLPEAAGLIVAYEPVWAIGSGRVPTTEQIGEVHGAMRAQLAERFGSAGREIPLLYGGSVKGANAAEIFAVPEVNGALVGGASLTAAAFLPIIAALAAA